MRRQWVWGETRRWRTCPWDRASVWFPRLLSLLPPKLPKRRCFLPPSTPHHPLLFDAPPDDALPAPPHRLPLPSPTLPRTLQERRPNSPATRTHPRTDPKRPRLPRLHPKLNPRTNPPNLRPRPNPSPRAIRFSQLIVDQQRVVGHLWMRLRRRKWEVRRLKKRLGNRQS